MEFPSYTARESAVDGMLHGLGLVAGIAGILWLLGSRAGRVGPADFVALLVYAGGLAGMLAASAAYNLSAPGPRKEMLRRLDHAQIFVMIAGTYTPFAVKGLGSGPGAPFWSVWGAAAAGAFLKLAFPRRFERVGLVLYLGLGWAILAMARPLWTSFPPGILALLVLGGALYTLGAIFHLLERLPFHNAAWHGLVLAAAACHFAAVATL
ncbi:PAQR family membrane homeostasis protein TrhA [Arenibaculum pallidiluteum]|uniref:PAQR family membrane homeostasis protein TrhA n=1 Tax=Arenibaculum pallidiluteum TaxID=2812559 RepID=UPI001A95CDED|nr:hemolysin III family protein [Arenibaculum pallidiluteum]